MVAEHLPQKASPLSLVLIYRLDGAYSEVGGGATAFGGGRSPRYAVFIIAMCPTPEMLVADRAWVRSLWEALRPHAAAVSGPTSTRSTEYDEDRVRAPYGAEKYERLATIKASTTPTTSSTATPTSSLRECVVVFGQLYGLVEDRSGLEDVEGDGWAVGARLPGTLAGALPLTVNVAPQVTVR